MTSTLHRRTANRTAADHSGVPAQAPAPGPVAARFRCSPGADSWWWSPEMHELHRVAADGVPPRARTLLDLLQPADRQRARAALAAFATGPRSRSRCG